MTFTHSHIQQLAIEHYGIKATVADLPGELDFNFRLSDGQSRQYTLKIANQHEKRENLDLQNKIMAHLGRKDTGLEVPQVVASLSGEQILEIKTAANETRFMRMLTWVDGEPYANRNPHSTLMLERIGELAGKLSHALVDFDHPAAHRFMKWDPSQAEWIEPHIELIRGKEEQEIVRHFYGLYQKCKPQLEPLRKGVNYSDSNDYNVLVSGTFENPVVPGVIDFGDVVYSHTINELAIMLAYVMMHKPDPLEAALHVVRGCHQVWPLTEDELAVLFPMAAARLIISVVCSAMNKRDFPENTYLQISDRQAWELLRKLRAIPPAFAHYSFRSACGFLSCPTTALFESWVLTHHEQVSPVVDIHEEESLWLDLSISSADLGNMENIEDGALLNKRVVQLMKDGDASSAVGRYDEVRALYTTEGFASMGNNGPEWRTLHMGLDFFLPEGSPVWVPLDGTLHSYADNSSPRDYGPTIILEHRISKDLVFYTLYGHLSKASLVGLSPGKSFKKGEQLGTIGGVEENGGWPPHLHFQIVLDMLDKHGEFPGVASFRQLDVWTSLCPDPWWLLRGKQSKRPATPTPQAIVDYRLKHLGKNLSISYRRPLLIERGYQAYLYDHTGRRYLDTVNNVAHVGHEHPRVVRAGQRQMAVLNTNTRYLHPNIIRFTESLLHTFPAPLEVAFIVNSGSEANELALRLAKTFTRQKDMIVVEVGYHGNTNACVDISSYKFDRKGGSGAPMHTHVVPIPDSYRGIYRGDGTGNDYAHHVQKAIQSIQQQGRGPAAFIAESILSCGGQIVLPENYLKECYRHTREAGGVCIADEVQTGVGRVGDHFWAFQLQGVIPDIVTIGKPIGNGHPLGVVVTTQEIADAFRNGMEYFNTFGGNPVSCAIGHEVLDVVRDENLQQHAMETGEYLMAALRDLQKSFPLIGDVRGKGLFLGIELVEDADSLQPATDKASYLCNRMRELGVLMSSDGPYDNVIKIKPPLVFNRSHCDFLLTSLDRVLREDAMQPK